MQMNANYVFVVIKDSSFFYQYLPSDYRILKCFLLFILFIQKLDIDECNDGVHNCTNKCINNIGSYTCDCPIGEQLDVDGLTCIGEMIKAQNKSYH